MLGGILWAIDYKSKTMNVLDDKMCILQENSGLGHKFPDLVRSEAIVVAIE